MKFMVDTNTCIYFIKNKSPKLQDHFRSQAVGDIGISTITLAELRFGVEKSQHVERNRQALEEFLLPLEIADFDKPAADAYGLIRAQLEKAGTPIGPLDLQIGAHALSLSATLITNNIKEFNRIKGLNVTDWTV